MFLEDNEYNHVPCGDAFFGGHFRVGCVLKCCIVPEVHGDTDSGWDTDDQSEATYCTDATDTDSVRFLADTDTVSEDEDVAIVLVV